MSDKLSEEQEDTTEEAIEDVESLKTLRCTLEEAIATSEKYLNSWQRTQADFDNYKKRAVQERSESVRFGNTNLICKLIPVLDDFERAFKSLPEDMAESGWVEGFRLISQKIQKVLESEGVSEIKAEEETFDPMLHEAIMQGEGEENKVVQEVERGYKLHERVIRPSKVVVGKGDQENEVGI